MNKQEMIDKIYEVIADKTLSMGCKLSYYNRGYLSDYITYYKILSSRITIETRWSCNFPEWHKFVESLKDNEVWDMIIKKETNKYQRNRLRYLLEGEYNNLIYYKCNVKYTPDELVNNTSHLYKDIDWYKIIWHPVNIGDVLKWVAKNIPKAIEVDAYMKGNKYIFEFEDITNMQLLWMRQDADKPLEDQSEECITFVYNLLPID